MSKWETNIAPYIKEIEEWAAHGISDQKIAKNLNIAYSTLRKYISRRQELSAALRRGKNRAERVKQKALQQQAPPAKYPRALSDPAPYQMSPHAKHPRPDQQGTHRGPYEKNKKRIYQTQEVCGICGRPVDKTLKYPHPMAPCIDHIIPIAKGGHPSDISNLQLAHWTCNRQKSDKLYAARDSVKIQETISNRILPQSRDWAKYRAGK